MLRFLLLLAGLSLPALSPAQTPGQTPTRIDFERCAAIESAAERLACFDALARPAAPVAEPTPAVAPLDIAPAAPTGQVLTPQPVATATPAAAVDRFGAESLPAPADRSAPERIESRLMGNFGGWENDTIFELENGQAWQCQNCRSVYHQAESPQISIRRSFTGVYWLKVEGLNQQAKVRRIR